MFRQFSLFVILVLSSIDLALGIVKYDEGRLEIGGVQLFQDSENGNIYYYLPPYPGERFGKPGSLSSYVPSTLVEAAIEAVD